MNFVGYNRKIIEKNEMVGACRTNGGEGEEYTGILVDKPEGKRDYLGDPGVHGRIIIKLDLQ
jgi:hypothetical protein